MTTKPTAPADERGADDYPFRERDLFRAKALFVIAGFLSFVLSVYLWFFVDKQQGLYVGLWVPSLWSLGALVLANESRAR